MSPRFHCLNALRTVSWLPRSDRKRVFPGEDISWVVFAGEDTLTQVRGDYRVYRLGIAALTHARNL